MTDTNNTPRPLSYVSLDNTSRALLDASVESALIMDIKGNVLAANDSAAKLFDRRDAKDLEQKNIYSMLSKVSIDTRREKVEEAITTAKPVRFEEEVDERVLLHSIVPVTTPWGKVGRLAVYTLDLTDLRRTDEGLRRKQQRQIFFMESLPGIVYHLYSDRTIRYANRYFRKYFGSPKNKLCHEALNCSRKDCESCPPHECHGYGSGCGMGLDRCQGPDLPPAMQPHDRLGGRTHDHGSGYRHHSQETCRRCA